MQIYVFFLFILSVRFFSKYNLPCAKALSGQNITRAGNNEFPSLVAILRYTGHGSQLESNVMCTATLISHNHILTSEHCLFGLENTYVLYIVASEDIRDGLQRWTLWWLSYNQWIVHFQYQMNLIRNDIAIVRLTRKVPNHCTPASLSANTVPQMTGWQVTIVGWGRGNNGRHPRYLEKATLTILSDHQCNDIATTIEGQQIMIPHTWFCSKANPYIFLELGDSGGPAFDRNGTLLGINIGNCPRFNDQFHPDKTNVHLAIVYYNDYITFCLGE